MVLKYYFEFSFFLSLTEWWLPCVTQKISLVFSSVLGIVQWIQRRNVMYGETDIFFENMSTKYFVMAASLYKTQSHHWWHRENRTICVACRLDCKGTLAGKKEETKWRACTMPYNSLDINVLDWAENSLIDRVVSDSPAVNGMNCAFCDTSMKLGM